MDGLLRYGAGLPFNRIAKLERGFGIPLPAATQWRSSSAQPACSTWTRS